MKWEYKLVDSRDIKRDGLFKGRTRGSVERYLGELGEQGWELINVDFRELEGRDSFTGIAKRPKEEATPRPAPDPQSPSETP